jgi:hypothetical protein
MIQNFFNVIKRNFVLKVMMGILAVCFSYYFIGCGVARAEDLSHTVGFDYNPERIIVKFTGSPQLISLVMRPLLNT